MGLASDSLAFQILVQHNQICDAIHKFVSLLRKKNYPFLQYPCQFIIYIFFNLCFNYFRCCLVFFSCYNFRGTFIGQSKIPLSQSAQLGAVHESIWLTGSAQLFPTGLCICILIYTK